MTTRTKRKKQQQQQQEETVKPKNADSEEETDEMEVDDDDDDDDEEQGVPDDDDMSEPIESSSSTTAVALPPPPTPRGSSSSSSAFLDSFYGLSSDDPKERAVAGQALLHYSVTGPDANVKDAAYALKRLLNGLCSGRAAARQGNASALTSFLKLAHVVNQEDDDDEQEQQHVGDCLLLQIQKDELEKEQKEKEESSKSTTNETVSSSTLQYVRRRLIDATDSTEGGTTRRKGSEERDYQFGRLFGILAVIRSGILLPPAKSSNNNINNEETEITSIASDLVQDLVELYQAKKWMREPAAHAVGTMLTLFYNHHTTTKSAKKKKGSPSSSSSSSSSTCTRIVQHLVEKVIIPQVLVEGDNAVMVKKKKQHKNVSLALFSTYSAEQIALALMIQSHYSSMDITPPPSPPSPLNVAVLSKETIPLVASALVETSSVLQPRVHLVWDAIFSYLSKDEETSSSSIEQPSSTNVSVRRPVQSLPIGGKEETVHDILDTLIQTVVVKGLLGGGSERQKESSSGGDDGDNKNINKATHERRSLALTLVRHMAGVEFVSSITGRMRLRLDAQTIETVVFCPVMIQLCFLKVVGAGTGFGGKKRQQGDHLLNPLALKVLEMVVDSSVNTDEATTEAEWEECMELRFALFKALIRCDPRFDGHTKTSTIANLVGLKHVAAAPASAMEENDASSSSTASFKQQCVFWDKYIEYLQGQILLAELPANEGPGGSSRNTTVTSSTASSFADLLLNLAKYLFRIPSDKDMDEYKSVTIRRILAFFMTTAFFDCRNVATKSKKKHRRPALQTALDVKEKRSSSLLPYSVRCVLSARFFSLLTEDVHAVLQSGSQSTNKTISLDTIGNIVDDWALLEEFGAARIEHPGQDENDGDDDEEEEKKPSLKEIVDQLRSQANDTSTETETKDALKRAQCRFAVGISLLSSILYVHSLSCGRSDEAPDEDGMDVDEAEDFAELKASISDIHDINRLFSKCGSTSSDNPDGVGGETPIGSLAVLCVNILSSPLVGNVNHTRGSSSKLLREVVKRAWIGGLTLYAASSDKAAVVSEVAGLLLNSIGAPMDEPMEVDRDEDDDMEDEEEQDNDENSDDEGVFARAANNADMLNDDEDEDEIDASPDNENTKGNTEEEDEEEIELDSERLKTFLEEDSDADVDEGVLEHHEGADAALAKLIKLKQDARKAGQQARERIEIAGNMRCMDLVESLLQGRPDGWGSLLRADIVLGMILPILRRRRQLEKAVAKSAPGKRSNPILGDKRALLDRYTSLLHKMLKLKTSAALTWPETVNVKDFSAEIATNILLEAKADVSQEHKLCCSDSLIVIMRSIPTGRIQDKFEVAGEVYGAAISEWATKKRTRLPVSLFDNFIQDSFVLAQGALPIPLCSAAKNATSSFLKADSFRLLALLYEPKRNPGASEMDLEALSRAQKSIDSILETTVELLEDSEIKKAKRAREILKTVEKVLDFKDARSNTSFDAKGTKKLVDVLAVLKEECDSTVVAGMCDKISARLKATEPLELSEKPDLAETAEMDDPVSTSKKSKKEKKKKAKKSKKKR